MTAKKKVAQKAVGKKAAKKKKASTTGKSREVDAWFAKLDNPQKHTMLAVRAAVLAADSRMSECIKWSSPTFLYEGNLASLQPNAKKFASLMFHRGSEISGRHPNLEGSGRLVRTMKFESHADVKAKRAALKAIVKAWCDGRP